jgi:hypothetical protein
MKVILPTNSYAIYFEVCPSQKEAKEQVDLLFFRHQLPHFIVSGLRVAFARRDRNIEDRRRLWELLL